jgi:hypothetical protein
VLLSFKGTISRKRSYRKVDMEEHKQRGGKETEDNKTVVWFVVNPELLTFIRNY